MENAVARDYSGGLGWGLYSNGVQGQSPWSGVMGAEPAKAKSNLTRAQQVLR